MGLGFPQTWFPCMSDNRKEGFFWRGENCIFPKSFIWERKNPPSQCASDDGNRSCLCFSLTEERELLSRVNHRKCRPWVWQSRLCLSRRCHADLTDSQSQLEEFAWDARELNSELQMSVCRVTSSRIGKSVTTTQLTLTMSYDFQHDSWVCKI